MKLHLFRRKKTKLKAATRRMPRRAAESYDEEPSMKLSNAFVVVLLLHVVAVGGIYAFNYIKTARTSDAGEPAYEIAKPAQTADFRKVSAMPESKPLPTKEQPSRLAPAEQPKPMPAAEKKPAAAAQLSASKPPATAPPQPAAKAVAVKDSGEIYEVVKGDNPVAIARKFEVSYEDLLRLNHIDDPRRLQIGQKLHIPVK